MSPLVCFHHFRVKPKPAIVCICDGWADVPGAFFNWLLIFSPPSVTLKRAYVCLCICTGVSNESNENLSHGSRCPVAFFSMFAKLCCLFVCVAAAWLSNAGDLAVPSPSNSILIHSDLISLWWCNRTDLRPICLPQDVFCLGCWGETTFIWQLMMSAIDRDVVSRHRPACSHNDPSQFH